MPLPCLLAVLSFLLTAVSSSVTPEDCQSITNRFSTAQNFRNIFKIQDGSTFSTCRVDGPQCCSPLIIQLFTRSISSFINTDTFSFTTGGLANAEEAIDLLRNETSDLIADITENNVRPLLLSVISHPNDDFTAKVDSVMSEITFALNGNHIDLKQTLYKYVRAVAANRLDELLDNSNLFSISLTEEEKECAIQHAFHYVYNNTDAASEMVALLQNISTSVGVIKQLPAIFDELLVNIKQFKLSRTCVDVLTSNFLCPMCVNQPLMCPGRCNEIVIGCLSPLNQAVVQLDASLRLIFSIIKGLAGFPDRSTDSVNINRIPDLYESLSDTLQNEFVTPNLISELLVTCDIQLFGKRSVDQYHQLKNDKRSIAIPEVKINQSLFEKLEKYFSSAAGDELSSAKEELCSTTFNIPVGDDNLKIVTENGICSYGVGNVGAYSSAFIKTDVIHQAYDNPAGFFNYTELIDQAKSQTYVLTKLFSTTDIPESVFSIFLPNETLPTTEFLLTPPPPPPPTVPSSSPDATPNGNDNNLAGSGASLVSYSLMLVWGCLLATLLF